MKIKVIEDAAKRIPKSLWNGANKYEETRNVLIRCLARESNRTQAEVILWLESNNKKVIKLKEFKITDGSN